jgi:hypothetical protein
MPVSKKASGITTMPAETLNYNGEITWLSKSIRSGTS